MNVIQQEKKEIATKKTIAKIVKRYADLSKKHGKPLTKSGKMDISMSLFYGRDDDFNTTNRLRGAQARCTLGNLDLDKLLEFEDFSFVHDVVGISSTIVKSSAQANFGTFSNGFMPRCGFVFASDNKRSKKGGVSDAADEKGSKGKAKKGAK